jgi:hypothetical protein
MIFISWALNGIELILILLFVSSTKAGIFSKSRFKGDGWGTPRVPSTFGLKSKSRGRLTLIFRIAYSTPSNWIAAEHSSMDLNSKKMYFFNGSYLMLVIGFEFS